MSGRNSIGVDDVTMGQPQQTLGDTVNEDAMDIPPVEVSQSHNMTNHRSISPTTLTNSESSEHILASPIGSPNPITMAESPAGVFTDPEQGNRSPAMPTSPQVSGYIASSPEASSSTIMLVESPANSEASGYTLSYPLVIASRIPIAQSPTAEPQSPPKKRRGRKPKSAAEKDDMPSIKQTNARKIWVYEIDRPFDDKEKEKKRLNAVKARRHRLIQKEAMKNMEQRLTDAIAEIDSLKRENEELKMKVATLTQQLQISLPAMTIHPVRQQLPQ